MERHLELPPGSVARLAIVKKAVDARRYHGAPIQFVYTLDAELRGPERRILARLGRGKQLSKAPDGGGGPSFSARPRREKELRPVVVGFGPAGIFAALELARQGWQPVVLERGQAVERRQEDVARFWGGGTFSPASNVQFGEGGAGAFSDGKLTTRLKDPLGAEVLEALIEAGAPEEIRYLHKPHLGTDRLRGIVKGIRERILRLGGEVRFCSQATDFETRAGQVAAVIVNGEERIPADAVFLGIGHSARDTYAMLLEKGISMEAKAFAMGVRIEHPQSFIDRAQYGDDAGHPRLPAADYALTAKAGGRGVYTFCMCPGGQVVAAASEEGGVAVNGMSCYRRDSGIANSALLVTTGPEDFGSDALAGIRFQREWEKRAFLLGGGDFRAPVQSVGEFLQGGSGGGDFLVAPTYRPGVRPGNLRECLPEFVADALAEALPVFDRKLPGFAAPNAPMTGVETRSSAPCRIRRDREDFVSESIGGLYPIGEGAGYAGGIMSAAMDGLKAARAFLRHRMEMEA